MKRKSSSRVEKALRDVGEEGLYEAIFPLLPENAQVVVGAGDDCAVLEWGARRPYLLFKTDAIVQGVHFVPDAPPSLVGRKALARCISDMAAMGGEPRSAVVTLAAPAETALSTVRGFYRGMRRIAQDFEVSLVGGESVASARDLMISVSMIGEVEKRKLVLRSGGQVGDVLLVTGKLGGSLRGKHLRFKPRLAEARWLVENATLHALIDLSDGLGSDLPRLAQASGLGYQVDLSALPRNRGCSAQAAIGDGEDYELLMALPAGKVDAVRRAFASAFPRVLLTPIGQLVRREAMGSALRAGYLHFSKGGGEEGQ